ncbi:unnamed protein product [Pleuronectes platessa]|uniref:Uncharacterized protein n=1 Tax=Pleuronectes platessa TaxID=8262 RepID=A0A9N7VHR4_PLEPL|nr:unnamed protein product [Pleuronectes platessa]
MDDLPAPLTPSQPLIDSAPAGQTGVKPPGSKGHNTGHERGVGRGGGGGSLFNPVSSRDLHVQTVCCSPAQESSGIVASPQFSEEEATSREALNPKDAISALKSVGALFLLEVPSVGGPAECAGVARTRMELVLGSVVDLIYANAQSMRRLFPLQSGAPPPHPPEQYRSAHPTLGWKLQTRVPIVKYEGGGGREEPEPEDRPVSRALGLTSAPLHRRILQLCFGPLSPLPRQIRPQAGGRREPEEKTGWTSQAGPRGRRESGAGSKIRRQLREGTKRPPLHIPAMARGQEPGINRD